MNNIVHLCDCMDFMKDLLDKHYDLAIVDPPYGIGRDGYLCGKKNSKKWKNTIQKIYEKKDWDSISPGSAYFNELKRVANDLIVWGGNYFADHLQSSSCWIVWDKKNEGTTMADCELAYTTFITATRKFSYMWSGFYKQKPETRIHPTQKPIALYKWLLQNYAKPGWTIFDSHVGSGSLRIACHDLGFDFEGCEIDKDYWEAQEARYKNHIKQDELFEKEEIQKMVYQGELDITE